jgi:catechol 2,3-dioxygenase-like lactoylglutathione lyase family enzyme
MEKTKSRHTANRRQPTRGKPSVPISLPAEPGQSIASGSFDRRRRRSAQKDAHEPKGGFARLVPELHVQDLESSLAFWRDACGFQVAYRRTEERFVLLERAGAQLMLCQRHGRYETGTLDQPLGRGAMFRSTSTASTPFCLFSTHSTGRYMSSSAIAGIGLATEREACANSWFRIQMGI